MSQDPNRIKTTIMAYENDSAAVAAAASTAGAATATPGLPLMLMGLEATLGPELLQKIQTCKVLLVGAGGIGCELLKNLALSGFRDIKVIDLDTIDVSNLNRQLLFRSQHVGLPKCTVACDVGRAMVDDPSVVQYSAHHGNVCDNNFFNVPYVEQFDLVLNALDNVTARRRVNRLCLAAAVPLVEAGTTGYLGQVNVMDKASNVACYECVTQAAPKVYPICTIRSTPSMPVHTIVWAKELYKLLFGEKEAESMLFEDENINNNASEATGEDGEAGNGSGGSTYMPVVLRYRELCNGSSTGNATAIQALAVQLVQALYGTEIQKQLDMDRYNTALKTPHVLGADVLHAGADTVDKPPSQALLYRATDTWTPTQCVSELLACLVKACRTSEPILPSFDKDDDFAMQLVTAASNLRNHVFGIEPLQSLYETKGIAGNIIPAIATTNAIAAGLQILQAFRVLQCQLTNHSKTGCLADYCSYINCVRNCTRNGLYLTAAALEKPNPACFVCRNALVPLALDTTKWTLEQLLVRVIKKDLGFQAPTISLDSNLIWEEGDDADSEAFATNLAKTLDKLPCGGIVNGTLFSIEDFTQDLDIGIKVTHQDVWPKSENEEDGDRAAIDENDLMYEIRGTKPAVAPPPPPEASTGNSAAAAAVAMGEAQDGDQDDVVVLADGAEKIMNGKRPAEIDSGTITASPAKKARVNENGNGMSHNDNVVVEIDDD